MPEEKRVKLLVVDVDGTLTDGKIYIDQKGNETKSFYVQDGSALKMLMSTGVKVAFLSGRDSLSVEKRARELGIHNLYQGIEDKFSVLAELMKQYNITLSEVAFIGDDLPDLPVLRQVGFSVSPQNASRVIKEFSHYVTEARGGEGAVAEACEKILRRHGDWDKLVSEYL
jgi:3-deoxy-D-manno-octulosonate 8-phosphate phosphatase (KDO 8-P phosphatase)